MIIYDFIVSVIACICCHLNQFEGLIIDEGISVSDFEKLKELLYDAIDDGTFKDSLSVTVGENGVVNIAE